MSPQVIHVEQFDDYILLTICTYLNLLDHLGLLCTNLNWNRIVHLKPITVYQCIYFRGSHDNGDKLIHSIQSFTMLPNMFLKNCFITFKSMVYWPFPVIKILSQYLLTIHSLEIVYDLSLNDEQMNNRVNEILGILFSEFQATNINIKLCSFSETWCTNLIKLINHASNIQVQYCCLNNDFWFNLPNNIELLKIYKCQVKDTVKQLNINSIEELNINRLDESNINSQLTLKLISKTVHKLKIFWNTSIKWPDILNSNLKEVMIPMKLCDTFVTLCHQSQLTINLLQLNWRLSGNGYTCQYMLKKYMNSPYIKKIEIVPYYNCF